MKIERTKYVIISDDGTEIWCGLPSSRHYRFVKISELENTVNSHILTFKTRKAAETYSVFWKKDFEIVECKEIYEFSEPTEIE
jgi:hypothetical protein